MSVLCVRPVCGVRILNTRSKPADSTPRTEFAGSSSICSATCEATDQSDMHAVTSSDTAPMCCSKKTLLRQRQSCVVEVLCALRKLNAVELSKIDTTITSKENNQKADEKEDATEAKEQAAEAKEETKEEKAEEEKEEEAAAMKRRLETEFRNRRVLINLALDEQFVLQKLTNATTISFAVVLLSTVFASTLLLAFQADNVQQANETSHSFDSVSIAWSMVVIEFILAITLGSLDLGAWNAETSSQASLRQSLKDAGRRYILDYGTLWTTKEKKFPQNELEATAHAVEEWGKLVTELVTKFDRDLLEMLTLCSLTTKRLRVQQTRCPVVVHVCCKVKDKHGTTARVTKCENCCCRTAIELHRLEDLEPAFAFQDPMGHDKILSRAQDYKRFAFDTVFDELQRKRSPQSPTPKSPAPRDEEEEAARDKEGAADDLAKVFSDLKSSDKQIKELEKPNPSDEHSLTALQSSSGTMVQLINQFRDTWDDHDGDGSGDGDESLDGNDSSHDNDSNRGGDGHDGDGCGDGANSDDGDKSLDGNDSSHDNECNRGGDGHDGAGCGDGVGGHDGNASGHGHNSGHGVGGHEGGGSAGGDMSDDGNTSSHGDNSDRGGGGREGAGSGEGYKSHDGSPDGDKSGDGDKSHDGNNSRHDNDSNRGGDGHDGDGFGNGDKRHDGNASSHRNDPSHSVSGHEDNGSGGGANSDDGDESSDGNDASDGND